MNHASRALLAVTAALTLLGAGAGAALADDKHGPDSSHGDDPDRTPPEGDGVCSTMAAPVGDPILDIIPVDEADLDDSDCADELGMEPEKGSDQLDECDNLVLPVEDIPDFMGCDPSDDEEDLVNAQ